MRLLVTRPQPDAQRTAAILRGRGHDVTIAPLLCIEAIAGAEIDAGPWAAILITSANAAQAIATHPAGQTLRSVPVFAVGQRSAEAMRKLGFAEVNSADGGVDNLARLVIARIGPKASLLYLAGEERSGNLADDLGRSGLAVRTAVIYRAVAAAELPQAAVDVLTAGLGGVLHYSRRSAETYLNAAQGTGFLEIALSPAHFCLSVQVAEPLARAGARVIRVAAQPTEAALIELIGTKSR